MPRKPVTVAARAMFPAEIDGKTVIVLQGARLQDDHPLVKARPELFEPTPPARRERKR